MQTDKWRPFLKVAICSVLFYNFCLFRHISVLSFLNFTYLFIIMVFFLFVCPILVSEELAIELEFTLLCTTATFSTGFLLCFGTRLSLLYLSVCSIKHSLFANFSMFIMVVWTLISLGSVKTPALSKSSWTRFSESIGDRMRYSAHWRILFRMSCLTSSNHTLS